MRLLKVSLVCISLLVVTYVQAQKVGIGTTTPNNSAMLDIVSANKGLLIPRVETSAVSAPATGLLVFQPSDNHFYYYTGTAWRKLNGLVIDSDGDTKVEAINQAGNDYIPFTLDGVQKLIFTRNASGELLVQPQNFASAGTYFGRDAGLSDQGTFNTAIGSWALQQNSTGTSNTAVGANALNASTTGSNNAAFGSGAMLFNTTGSNSAAFGMNALRANTTGSSNIAIGREALSKNTTRAQIVAIGDSALHFNQNGSEVSQDGELNTAVGSKAMLKNTIGKWNVAFGYQAMKANVSGVNNAAFGKDAMHRHTTGSANTAIGTDALWAHLTGDANIAIGNGAIGNNTTGSNNIGIGWRSGFGNITGSNNIFIGLQAGNSETGSNKLYIENSGLNADTALIYGEFNTNLLRLNAHTEVNTYNAGFAGVRSIIKAPIGTSIDVAAVHGENTVTDFYGYGVFGKGGYIGVKGEVNGVGQGSQTYFAMHSTASGNTTGTKYAYYGEASGTGTKYGLYTSATGGGTNYGVYASASGATNYGGYFIGRGYFSESVGIGINNPAELLHLVNGTDPTILLQSDGVDELSGKLAMRQSNLTGADIYYDGHSSTDAIVFETFTSGVSNGRKMTLDLDGNVGIGITENIASGHKLSVNGKIACTEVRVQPQSAWPDYVFHETYDLMPLDALKSAIDQQNHLPGIPSAEEIKADGLQLGEMQTQMMEKIEELTLYVLQLHDEIKSLKQDNQQQADEITRLKSK